jgi:hypothetical protein
MKNLIAACDQSGLLQCKELKEVDFHGTFLCVAFFGFFEFFAVKETQPVGTL